MSAFMADPQLPEPELPMPTALPAEEVSAAQLLDALYGPATDQAPDTPPWPTYMELWHQTGTGDQDSVPYALPPEETLLAAVGEMRDAGRRWALLHRYANHQVLDLHWRWHPQVPTAATRTMLACPLGDLLVELARRIRRRHAGAGSH